MGDVGCFDACGTKTFFDHRLQNIARLLLAHLGKFAGSAVRTSKHHLAVADCAGGLGATGIDPKVIGHCNNHRTAGRLETTTRTGVGNSSDEDLPHNSSSSGASSARWPTWT